MENVTLVFVLTFTIQFYINLRLTMIRKTHAEDFLSTPSLRILFLLIFLPGPLQNSTLVTSLSINLIRRRLTCINCRLLWFCGENSDPIIESFVLDLKRRYIKLSFRVILHFDSGLLSYMTQSMVLIELKCSFTTLAKG